MCHQQSVRFENDLRVAKYITKQCNGHRRFTRTRKVFIVTYALFKTSEHTQSLCSEVDERSTLKDQRFFPEFHLHASLQDHDEIVAVLATAVQVTLG